MKRPLPRQALFQAVIIVLLCLPLVMAGAYLFNKYQWAQTRLADLGPRHARLLGLEASGAELARALSESVATTTRHAYPAAQDVNQAGNDAQQRVRDVSSTAGLSIVSSQVLPPKVESRFDRIPLTVQLEGEMPALQATLVALANQAPAINVESLSVQATGAIRGEVPQRLSIKFGLFVLRARP